MIAHGDHDDIAPLIAEWCEDIGKRLEHCAIHVRTCRRVASMFCAWAKIRSADQIDPLSVMRWLRARGDRVSRKTALNEMSVIRTFVDWLVSAGHLEHNRIAGIRLPRAPKSRGCQPFTIDEARAIIEAADLAESSSGRSRIHGPLRSSFYTVMLLTGLRFSEMRAQRWDDIHFGERWLRVTHDKSRRCDVIPLSAQTVAALRRWRNWSTGELVFPNAPCNKSLDRDQKAAGVAVQPGNWHRFRKCLITTLRRKGASINEICRIARHVDPKTTMNSYDWHELDDLRKVTELFPSLPKMAGFGVDTRCDFADKTRGNVHAPARTNSEDVDARPSARENVAPSNGAGRASISSGNSASDQRTWRDSNPPVPDLFLWLTLADALMRKGASWQQSDTDSSSQSSDSRRQRDS